MEKVKSMISDQQLLDLMEKHGLRGENNTLFALAELAVYRGTDTKLVERITQERLLDPDGPISPATTSIRPKCNGDAKG